MKIIIDNVLELIDFPKNIKDFLMEKLTFINPKYEDAQRLGYSTRNIAKYVRNFEVVSHNQLNIPRGYRKYLIDALNKKGADCEVVDNRSVYEFNQVLCSTNIKLRSYQRDYLHKLLINDHEEGIIVAAPGSGKTVLGIALSGIKGQPTLWLTHTKNLLKQTRSRLEAFVPSLSEGDVGIIYDGNWNIGNLFTIGMIQTIIRNPDKLQEIRNSFGTVILDEAHHCPAKTFSSVVAALNPKYLYGLTATPYRGDKLEELMFQTIGPIIINIPTEEIVAKGGILMPVIKYKEIKTKKMEENNTAVLNKYLINNKKRNNIITRDILNEAFNGEVCIALSTRKKHCEILYELTRVSWEKSGIATGDYSDKENDATIKKLENGEITVIFTTPDLLGEGFDVDILSRGFICLPFRSETRIEQFIGRIQRSAPNKKDVVIYDYVDTNIGVFKDQFYTPNENKECRVRVYNRLNLTLKPAA